MAPGERRGQPQERYALTEQSCGQAPNAYPKLRIGMREGYCAGLVASGEDGLVFPRSIAQIPGHRQFVVADMGGGIPAGAACCCSIRMPRQASVFQN